MVSCILRDHSHVTLRHAMRMSGYLSLPLSASGLLAANSDALIILDGSITAPSLPPITSHSPVASRQVAKAAACAASVGSRVVDCCLLMKITTSDVAVAARREIPWYESIG